MRKTAIILAGLALPIVGLAADLPQHLNYKTQMYAIKIAPNGKYVANQSGEASLYLMDTGESLMYEESYFGLGNTVADNGWAVGDNQERAVLFKDGEIIHPATLETYESSYFNAITKDASRVVGFISNTEKNGIRYVPIICEIDASGNVGEPVILPYPKVDLFGEAPAYISAVWISDDGKTVAGQVQDWRGYYTYPIIFKEGENGEWSYSLPSEQLFNPTHIPMLKNPWTDEPEFPEPENFMSGVWKTAYLQALAAYSNGESATAPIPEKYMSDEEFERYKEAVEYYNDWYFSQEDRIKEYIDFYNEMLTLSPTFSDNEMALHPSGEYMMMHGGIINEYKEMEGKIYKFECDSNAYEEIETPTANIYPNQILSDGTLVCTTPMMDVPTSYLILPGTNEFITIEEYLQEFPSIVSWMRETIPWGSGLVSLSDDKSVLTGALMPGQLADHGENVDYYYSTYFVTITPTGVERIEVTPKDGTYKVYDLKGVKVLETKDASTITSLPKGVYVLNGKKVIL